MKIIWLTLCVFFPPEVTFTAYKELFTFPLMKTGYFSTIFVTVVGTALNIFLLCITAYPLSKRNLKGRNVIMALITFTMFFNGGMIPNYMLIRNLKLLDTYWALILPGAISAYNLILMRNFVAAIPPSAWKKLPTSTVPTSCRSCGR